MIRYRAIDRPFCRLGRGRSDRVSSETQQRRRIGYTGSRGGVCVPIRAHYDVENEELLVGDVLVLFSFCSCKQIFSIINSPHFPGVLAPLKFHPERFIEFMSFSLTVCSTWVAVSLLSGGYSLRTAERLHSLLKNMLFVWLVSMPVDASWLVLVASQENGVLVGEQGWADTLPLAVSGLFEPWVSAVQVCGVMGFWRAIYGTYLETVSFRTMRMYDKEEDERNFESAVQIILGLVVFEFVVIQFLSKFHQSS